MKITHFIAAVAFLSFTMSALCDERSTVVYVNNFYEEWSVPRKQAIDGRGYSMARFYHEVRPMLQAEVLGKILHRAVLARPRNYGVIGRAFVCLQNFGSGLTLTSQTDSDLFSLANDTNWVTRRDVMQVLSKLKRPKDHDMIVAGLNDPQDQVRRAAIDALTSQPDAKTIYQKFILTHEDDPAYYTSVLYAKSELDIIHARTIY